MKKRTKRGTTTAALFLAASLLFGGVALMYRTVGAADGAPSPQVIEKTADPASDWRGHMSEPDDTSEVGKIKTDKTVRTVGFSSVNRADGSVNDETPIGDDFTVTYSALSSGGTIAGTSALPVDITLVLDFSSSMNAAAVGSESRAAAMVDAVNSAIGELMRLNPENRVAAVAFSSSATTLFPLQSITPVEGNNYLSISNRRAGATYSNIRVTPSSQIAGGTAVTLNRGTNIQAGLYAGMNILTTSDPAVTIGGQEYNRAPGVILMTDGGPSSVVTESNWWSLSASPSTSSVSGITSASANNVAKYFTPLLTAAYMKNKIADHYENDCYIYSVGLGIANTSTNYEKAAAMVVLDPTSYVGTDGAIDISSTSYASGIGSDAKTAFQTAYTNLLVNKTAASVKYGSSNTLSLNYPSTAAAAAFMPADFKYNDAFTESTDGEDLAQKFIDAIATIAEKAYAPTDTTDMSGETTGYITYTDTLGELMTVKDVKSILWVNHNPDGTRDGEQEEGVEYTVHSSSTSGDITTYVFDHAVKSSWLFNYEDTNLNRIIIQVDRSGPQEVMTIKIPPALLPMVDYSVKKEGDEVTEVKRNEETRPIKINYIVGPKEGVVDYIAGDESAITDESLKAQADAYIADPANTVTAQDGREGIALYTNAWRGSDETTVPVAEFGINAMNNYYSFAKNTALYTDADCTQAATSFTAGTTYYFKDDVYIVGETGADADHVNHVPINTLSANDTVVSEGILHVKAGVAKELPADTPKDTNLTATRSYQLRSHWQNGKTVHQHQGNNGRLVIEQPGELQIDKDITVDEGVTGIDYEKLNAKKFEFTVTLTDASDVALSGSYNYVISNPSTPEADWETGTITSGGTVRITEDETVLISGLPNGSKYTVAETNIPAGYTLTKINGNAVSGGATSASGTIASGETAATVFENNYSFAGNELTISNRPYVKKVFMGRSLTGSDSFTMTLLPYASNKQGARVINESVTVSQSQGVVDSSDPNMIHHHFDGFLFTEPGEYWFRISETPGQIPGVTYSQSVYAYVINVHDNGDGTLGMDSDTDIQMVKTIDMDGTSVPDSDPTRVIPETPIPDGSGGTEQGHEATFTNTYLPSSVSIGTPGEKQYSDATGTKPLTADMFTFELRPSFYDADGNPLTQADIDAVPMPDGSEAASESEGDTGTNLNYKKKDTFNSASGDFGFGTITYGASDVGKTYRYVIQEIIPADALTSGMRHYVNREDETDTQDTTDDHGYLWRDGSKIYDLKTITYGGFVYDCSRHVVVVKVSDDGTGHILAKVEFQTAASAAADKVEISNRYEPAPAVTDEDIEIKKLLNGRDSQAGESFTFTLVPAGANAIAGVQNGWITLPGGDGTSVVTSTTISVDSMSDGVEKAAFFDDILFTRPGSYTFAITENAGSAGGMTYDRHSLSAIVTISDVDGDGTLDIESVNYIGNQTFTNTYTAESIDYGSMGALQIEKRLEGRAMVAESFGFLISPENDEAKEKTPAAFEVRNASNAAAGVEAATQTLTNMTFTLADAGKTFKYKITEVIPDGATEVEPGIYTYAGVTYAYDGLGVQEVEFVVTDNGDGTLKATATNTTTQETVESSSGPDGTISPLEVHFANKFTYEPLVYEPTAYTKHVEGREWKEGETFRFKLSASENAPLPTNTEVTVGYDAQHGNEAEFGFGSATFTEPGTYTYTIEELPPEGVAPDAEGKYIVDGLVYDTEKHTIQIVVSDSGDGSLRARVIANEASRTFTNTYHAALDFTEKGSVIDVAKTLLGRSIRDREFMVDVKAYTVMDGEEVKEGYATAEETAERFGVRTTESLPILRPESGNTYTTAAVPGIRFTEEDAGRTYAFEIREYVPASATDKKLDESSETTYKYEDGVYYNTNDVNHYLAEIKVEDKGDGTLKVTTTVTPHDEAHAIPDGKSAETIVHDGSLEETLAKAAVENTYDADGVAIINAIKDLEGREWTSDDAYRFKIDRMAISEGKLVPTEATDTPLPTGELTAIIEADLVGSDRSQHHAVRNPEDKESGTLRNGWELRIEEKDLTSENGGTKYADFYYKITEIVPPDATVEIEGQTIKYEDASDEIKAANRFVKDGVSYSHTPRYVHVHAQDTKSGGITTDVHYVTADQPTVDLGATPVFTNYSDVATKTIELKATKELNRNFKSDDAFSFAITSAGRTPMPANITVTRNNLGTETNTDTFSFGEVTYAATDLGGETEKVFTYKIVETAGNQSGITYEESAKELFVKVTDNKNGTLTVAISDTGEDGSYVAADAFTKWPVLKNNYTSPTRVYTVFKKWVDEDNRDGIRPTSVEVKLTGGPEEKTATLSEANNWHYSFTGLPVYQADGVTAYDYKVEEVAVDGYTASYAGTGEVNNPRVITNTHNSRIVSVTASKEWDDNDNALGLRTDVKLHLIGRVDGKVVYVGEQKTIALTADPLETIWEKVPVYSAGKEISYTVSEEAIFGYSAGVRGSRDEGFVVKNTLTAEPESISVVKEWQDADNQDGIRPQSVTYRLMQKVGSAEPTQYGEDVTKPAEDSAHSWTELPFEIEGEPVVYMVDEVSVADGYTKQVFSDGPGQFRIVNTHVPETYGDPSDPTETDDPTDDAYEGISVTKVWNDNDNAAGDRPEAVVFHLQDAQGTTCGEAKVAMGDKWTVGWRGVPKYKGGELIEYKIVEEPVANYTASEPVKVMDTHFTLTNTFNAGITVRAVKTWKDAEGNELTAAPEAVTVHLVKKVEGYEDTEVASLEIPADASGDALILDFGSHPTVEHNLPVTYHLREDESETYTTSYGDGTLVDGVLTLPVTNTQVTEAPPLPETVLVSFVDAINGAGTQVLRFGEVTADELADVDAIAPADPDHSAEGYTFQQWDRNDSTADDGTRLVTFVARYQYELADGMVTVAYVDGQAAAGNALLKSERTNTPAEVSAPADPAHEGYRFLDWIETIDTSGNHIFVATYEKIFPDCKNGKSDVAPPAESKAEKPLPPGRVIAADTADESGAGAWLAFASLGALVALALCKRRAHS